MDSLIGQYGGFNSVNLTGMTSMNARAPTPNGGPNYFLIRLDSPGGQVIGSGSVPATGDWQTRTTISCPITSVSGIHNVYLTFLPNGYGGDLYNFEWIFFQGVPGVIEAASYNSLSEGEQLETCSEGGQDMHDIANGNYAVYSQVKLAGMTSFKARVASAGSGGNIA